MSKQPESVIVSNCIKALRAVGAVAIKVHGSAFSRTGEPDILGCYKGRAFAIEVKQPGQSPFAVQWVRLKEWHDAGAVVGVAFNKEDALAIAIEGKSGLVNFPFTVQS